MEHAERVSLKVQLLRDSLPLILAAAVLVLVVDCFAVAHIREHSVIDKGGPGDLTVSLTRELIDVLPFLVLPHLLILATLYFWLRRMVDQRVFLPLLNLTTRFMNLKNGRPLPMPDGASIPKELEPLYDAYNKYAERLAASQSGVELPGLESSDKFNLPREHPEIPDPKFRENELRA